MVRHWSLQDPVSCIFSVTWLAGDVKEPTHLSERVGDDVPGVVGWVSEIKNGPIAAARGAFTSWRSISLNSIVNRHETSCDMCGIHIHSFIHSFIVLQFVIIINIHCAFGKHGLVHTSDGMGSGVGIGAQGALRSSVNQKPESEAESETRRNRSQKDQKNLFFFRLRFRSRPFRSSENKVNEIVSGSGIINH